MFRHTDLRSAGLVVVLSTGILAYTARPALGGTLTLWLIAALGHLALAALVLFAQYRDGSLVANMTPRWGDLSVGAVVALVLVLASTWARGSFAPPGHPNRNWVYQIYMQLGDPSQIRKSLLLTLLVVGAAVGSEIAWRGAVQPALAERLGALRGCLVASVLYALSAAPTAITLADPVSGYNPLLIIAALVAGLSWGVTAWITRRLPPVIISHALFAYFSAVDFRIPGVLAGG